MKKATIILIISICAITLFADWSIEQKVFAGDGSGEDYFGQSVSISGEYAIVGAPLKNFPLGAAYLHKRINNQWLEIEKIQASDSTNTQGFGSSVFINGDYMMISANHYYSNSSGSTYIYHNDGENWNEVDIITASGSPICDQYGCSVGITENGEYAIVGAYNDDENGENSGAVYVYQQINSEWNLQTKIMAYDGSLQDLFGCSVFITNNLIFVSAINDDDNGEESGSVYIYENNGTNWEFHSKIIASHNTSNDQFGVSISVCGDFLIVGTSCYDQGEAYIFHFDGENWTEVANLTASDGFDYDHFGRSVSISEDYAVIGACDCPDVGMSASAYFFEKEGTDWNELNKLTIDNWGAFGYSVSISGENAIVGANLDFGVSNATGAVYFISNDGTSIDQEIITYPQYNALISNYPNPFNPITTISFSLTTNLHEKARIEIFNIKGQLVETFSNLPITNSPNQQIVWNAEKQASGVYFYKLVVDDKTVDTKKMILLK